MKFRTFRWKDNGGEAQSLTVGQFTQGPDYRTIRPSGTDNYLFILTLSGCGRICSPDGTVLSAEPGTLLVFKPGSYHDYGTCPETGRWVLLWSHFVPGRGSNYPPAWPEVWPGLLTVHVDPLTNQRISRSLQEVLELPPEPGRLGADFAFNCLERIRLLVDYRLLDSSEVVGDPRLNPALVHIINNPEEPLAVDHLARMCGLSPSRFSHLFKQHMGSSPQVFVEARRMDLGRNLLLFSDLPVNEVARRCGFESPFYFSTRFRRATGQCPREFRRSQPA